jgi:hypothetical protein
MILYHWVFPDVSKEYSAFIFRDYQLYNSHAGREGVLQGGTQKFPELLQKFI